MKTRLAKLESIVQEYVAKDYVSRDKQNYLYENLETILYAIQQSSKVEEMKKTLEWYADAENYISNAKEGYASMSEKDNGYRARQALKGVTP